MGLKVWGIAQHSIMTARCQQFEWCELCSTPSTHGGLHSYEHAGQSEINVWSLGNTWELVSFIVLSPTDNCSPTSSKSECEKVWVPVCTCVCLSLAVFSNNHAIYKQFNWYFISLDFSECFWKTQLCVIWTKCVSVIDCGIWRLILFSLPSGSPLCP